MNRQVFISNTRLILLLTIAATLPTKWVNINSIAIISFVIVSGLDFLINRKKEIQFKMGIFLIFISFFLLTFLSIIYSTNLPPLLSKLETRLVVLAFPLALMGIPLVDKKNLEKVFAFFLISCLLISLLCLITIFNSNYSNGIEFHLSNTWFFSSDNLVEKLGFHPNYFSIYCAFSVFILFSFIKEKRINYWLAIVLCIYLFVFELFLALRVGILAFTLVFLLTIIYEFYIRKRLGLGIFLSGLTLGIIYLAGMNSQIVKDKFDALLNRNINVYNEPFRVNRRAIQWQSAIEVISSSPIVGVGVGDMQDELQKIYLEKNFAEGYDYAYNPHNLFLDSGVGLGILGILSNVILFVPSGPGLSTITKDHQYYSSLIYADIAIPDSGFMVLLFRLLFNKRIKKISGWKFLVAFLADEQVKSSESLFLINPSEKEGISNLLYLTSIGFTLNQDDLYHAPLYSGKKVIDPMLLSLIEIKKPRYILNNIGGGTQEKLGSYLKRNLSYRPAIICTGAAIAFLTGHQAKMPLWADKLYLGWLIRCVKNPKMFVPRYLKAFGLFWLIVKFGKNKPNEILQE